MALSCSLVFHTLTKTVSSSPNFSRYALAASKKAGAFFLLSEDPTCNTAFFHSKRSSHFETSPATDDSPSVGMPMGMTAGFGGFFQKNLT